MNELLAHAGHGGGTPNLLLLLGAGGALLLGMLAGTWRRAPRWVPWVALGAAVVLAGLAFLSRSGEAAAHSDAVVRIVEPEDGARVPAGRPVTVVVEVENGTVAASPEDAAGGHLHLYVDGLVQQMPYATRTRIEFEPGTHELRVEYVDSRHVSFEPEISTTISVTAERPARRG